MVQKNVRIVNNLCRVAVQIRSTPSYENNLTNVSVLMAVPISVNGDTVRMSHGGGVWDSFKRLIVWSLGEVAPGSTIVLQSLFEFNNPKDRTILEGNNSLKFPLVLRFSGKKEQLTNIMVDAVNGDSTSSNVETTLERSFRVLYRKL